MKSQELWNRWLLIVGWILVVFGLALAFLNQTWLFELGFNRQIDPRFWPDGTLDESARMFQTWIYGVLGATVCGWGVFVVFIARYPFRQRQTWSWYCLLIGITLWFVADTTISIYFGVLFNALFNTILAALVYIPLIATRRQFIA